MWTPSGMTTDPLFSIITVTRNNRAGLLRTAESVRNQTFVDYEWIVIDGSSSDGTQNFLSENNIPHISEPDRGIYDAMNKGMDRTHGEYVIFMNAGDRFAAPDVLADMAARIGIHRPDMIYGDAREGDETRSFLKRAKPHHTIDDGLFTHHQAIFYRRAALNGLRYDLSYRIAADYDLTRKILIHGAPVFYVPLAVCLFEPGGVSQTRAAEGRREQFVIRSRGGVNVFKNAMIYARQWAAWQLRRLCPALYAAWKARGPRHDNTDTAPGPAPARPRHP